MFLTNDEGSNVIDVFVEIRACWWALYMAPITLTEKIFHENINMRPLLGRQQPIDDDNNNLLKPKFIF